MVAYADNHLSAPPQFVNRIRTGICLGAVYICDILKSRVWKIVNGNYFSCSGLINQSETMLTVGQVNMVLKNSCIIGDRPCRHELRQRQIDCRHHISEPNGLPCSDDVWSNQ